MTKVKHLILLPDEEVVVTSDDNKTILTNIRLIVNDNAYSGSLFLEEISSVSVSYYSDVYYLLLGVVFVFCVEQFLFTFQNNVSFLTMQLLSCAIVVLLWWFFRRAKIIVSPKNGQSIIIMVNRKAFSKIPDFIYQIESGKSKRLTMSVK